MEGKNILGQIAAYLATEEIPDFKVQIPEEDMTQLILSITKEEFNLLMISKDLISLEIQFSNQRFPQDLLYQVVENHHSINSHQDSVVDLEEVSEALVEEVSDQTNSFEKKWSSIIVWVFNQNWSE